VLDWMNRLVASHVLAWFDAEIYTCDGFQLWFEGQLDDALKQLDAAAQSFDLRPPDGRVSPLWLLPNDPLVARHVGLMCIAALQGRATEAENECRLAHHRAAEVPFPRGPFSEAFVSIYEAWFRLTTGNEEDARRCAANAIAVADRYGFVYLRVIATPYLFIASRESPGAADDLITAAYVMAEVVGQLAFLAAHYVNLALVHEFRNEPDLAMQAVNDGLALVERTGERLHLPDLLRLRGRYLLQEGATSAAVESIRSAAELATRQGHHLAALKAGLELAGLPADIRPRDWRSLLVRTLDQLPQDCAFPDVIAARSRVHE
jgi:hypothetical protein